MRQEPTHRRNSYTLTRQSRGEGNRRSLKRRKEELYREEVELDEADEQENRDYQNMATELRKKQGYDAWREYSGRYGGQWLMADTKTPTRDEPTDLRLTPDEYDERDIDDTNGSAK